MSASPGERPRRKPRAVADRAAASALHITSELPPLHFGGLGVSLAGLVAAAGQAGAEVSVLLVDPGGGGYGSPASIGGPYGYADRPSAASRTGDGVRLDGSSATTLVEVAYEESVQVGIRLARDRRPDILHLHSSWLWPIASEIRAQLGIPILYTLHSIDRVEIEAGEWIPHGDVQDAAIAGADMLVALSSGDRSNLLRHYPDAGPVRVIGNGIECSSENCNLPRADGGRVRVLYVGRFAHRKGIEELLAAVPLVLERHPDVEFLFVGGGSRGDSSDVAAGWLPDDLRWDDRIRFAGWQPDPAPFYRSSHILVVPSRYEPFGLVVLEGMCAGIAIAATTTSGPNEILRDNVTSLLFPPRDVERLTEAVSRLVADAALRRRLGQAAAEDVRQRWNWSRIYARIDAAYRETTLRHAWQA